MPIGIPISWDPNFSQFPIWELDRIVIGSWDWTWNWDQNFWILAPKCVGLHYFTPIIRKKCNAAFIILRVRNTTQMISFLNGKMNKVIFKPSGKLGKFGIGYSWTEIGKLTQQLLGIGLELGLRFPESGTTNSDRFIQQDEDGSLFH